jgi:signal transduction histidine kinase
MNKNLYIKIILFPIILTIISILTITIYNINQINNHYNKLIQQKEVEFENREKNYVYNKVRSVVEKIKYDRMFFENRIKQDLKQKVDIINSMINSYYNSNHKLLPPTTLKENIIKLVESYPFKEKDNYFFLIDMNSSKILSHKIASFKDKPMRKHTDITGTNLFETQKILSLKEDGGFQKVYFSKPTKGNKEFSKIVYVKKVPHFNWFIGTGEYLDVVEGDIQKAVLKELDYLEYDKNRYIFILEVYNKNGGKNFAKMLLNPNKPELVGNKISDDLVDAKGMYHRKEYLKGLKNSNDFYLEYYYKKPNTLKDAKKGTYFYYFDKWKWIIGAGFYFEDLENEINIIHLEANKEIQKEVINAILFSFVLTIIVALLSYIVARKLNKAFRSYINDI